MVTRGMPRKPNRRSEENLKADRRRDAKNERRKRNDAKTMMEVFFFCTRPILVLIVEAKRGAAERPAAASELPPRPEAADRKPETAEKGGRRLNQPKHTRDI